MACANNYDIVAVVLLLGMLIGLQSSRRSGLRQVEYLMRMDSTEARYCEGEHFRDRGGGGSRLSRNFFGRLRPAKACPFVHLNHTLQRILLVFPFVCVSRVL
jgi:hypothetical protein